MHTSHKILIQNDTKCQLQKRTECRLRLKPLGSAVPQGPQLTASHIAANPA